MRFEISRSLNGDKILYIARDTGGIVRLRKETFEEIQEAIKEFNQVAAESAAQAKSARKGKRSRVKGHDEGEEVNEGTIEPEVEGHLEQTESPLSAEVLVNEDQPSGGKKFLHSELKEDIEEKKRKSGKKSFWDKLK